MSKSVFTVEYLCDAGRREYVLFGVCNSPESARKAVEDAIEEFYPEAIVKTTDMSGDSLKKWVSEQPWTGGNHVWYLSKDGLFAMCNAWTEVRTDIHEVRGEEDDIVSESIPNAAERASAALFSDMTEDSFVDTPEAFSATLGRMERALTLIGDALRDGHELSHPMIDLTYWTARLCTLAGRLDEARKVGRYNVL